MKTLLFAALLVIVPSFTVAAQQPERRAGNSREQAASQEQQRDDNQRTSINRRASNRPDQQQHAQHLETPTEAVAMLVPKSGSKARGLVKFKQMDDHVHITGMVSGLEPGEHGFHVHQFGDLSSEDGSSAGDHFNPHQTQHGGPEDEMRHAGDLGNITANDDGEAEIDIQTENFELHFVIGRALVVHAEPDDLESQPSGNAGDRIAVGVIGIAKTQEATPASTRRTNSANQREREEN